MINQLFSKRVKSKGFTLIEVLTVIAIIGILITFFTPALSKSREKARVTKDMNNMKQLGYLISMYVMDENKFPDTLDDLVTKNYLKASDLSKLRISPLSAFNGKEGADAEYVYAKGAEELLTSPDSPYYLERDSFSVVSKDSASSGTATTPNTNSTTGGSSTTTT